MNFPISLAMGSWHPTTAQGAMAGMHSVGLGEVPKPWEMGQYLFLGS